MYKLFMFNTITFHEFGRPRSCVGCLFDDL